MNESEIFNAAVKLSEFDFWEGEAPAEPVLFLALQ